MEDVLIYGIIFAGLLAAAKLFQRSAQRLLDTPPPWAERHDLEAARERIDLAPWADVQAIEEARDALPGVDYRRPFDRCWPGTDVPKRGC